jgi:hypothetical protein
MTIKRTDMAMELEPGRKLAGPGSGVGSRQGAMRMGLQSPQQLQQTKRQKSKGGFWAGGMVRKTRKG